MKQIAIVLLFISLGCADGKPYDTSFTYFEANEFGAGTVSLIEHPYIFEDLGLRLDAFYYKKEGGKLLLKSAISGDIEDFKDCIFYTHVYPYEDAFINLDLGLRLQTKNKLFFEREVKLPDFNFEEIRFGLACSNQNKRPISLSLKDIIIY